MAWLTVPNCCGVTSACLSNVNHCPTATINPTLHYTISSNPVSCLHGFSDSLIWNPSTLRWVSPNPTGFGTATSCLCSSPGALTHMGVVFTVSCLTSPPFWTAGFSAFGGCNNAGGTCSLGFTLVSTLLASCTPFHLRTVYNYNNLLCRSGESGMVQLTFDVTE